MSNKIVHFVEVKYHWNFQVIAQKAATALMYCVCMCTRVHVCVDTGGR